MSDRDNTFVVGRIVTRGIHETESKKLVTRRDVMMQQQASLDRAKANQLRMLNNEV